MSLSTLRKFDGETSEVEPVLGINFFLAPRPSALAQPYARWFVIERALEIVDYRNRKINHTELSDLNDPYFAECEWLVVWERKDAGRQTDWMRHEVCMKCMAPLVEEYLKKWYDLTKGADHVCSAMCLPKTPDPTNPRSDTTTMEPLLDKKVFLAPRPYALAQPNPLLVNEPVSEIVGYRNRKSIHSLSDLNDPQFAEGQWLVLWEEQVAGRSQTNWLNHDTCMNHIASLVEKYVEKLYDLETPRSLSMMAGYISSIDDVTVQEILYEGRNNMYVVGIASLSESFVNEAIHPRFSKNIMNRFTIGYNMNSNEMHVILPKLLVKYAYPDLVSTFNAEVSRRQQLCGHKACKEKRCWTKEKCGVIAFQFIVRDKPFVSRIGQYTTIQRPIVQSADTTTRCDLTSPTVATVGTCCCMKKCET